MKGKKKYVKPRIEEIQLRAEEAVLAGCKASGGGVDGPGFIGKCKGKMGPGAPAPCSTLNNS